MGEMKQRHIQDILPGYALGILDADEVEYVDRHLAECEFCRAELTAYTAVVDVLPLAAPEADPSPALKGRLLARMHQAAAVQATAVAPKPSWWNLLGQALQSLVSGPVWRPVALVLIIVLTAGNFILFNEINRPDDNSWRRVYLSGTEMAPDSSGIIYISADGQNGTIIVDHLPQLTADQQYQLWLIQDGQRSSGAVFSVDDDGYRGLQINSSQPLQDFEEFGVTIEPAGGSPGPTGDKVLGYNSED